MSFSISKPTSGFTLIELMVVVAIVGILAAIAIPSYTDYVDKARRTDAINGISNLATALERYYSINNRYTATLSGLPDPASTTSPDRFYNMTVTSSANQSFTVTATRNSALSTDTQCDKFLLTDTGIKTAQDSATGDSTSSCWKIR